MGTVARRVLLVALVVLLGGLVGGCDDADDDPLRRTTLRVRVDGQPPMLMDLGADPPVMEPAPGAAPVEVDMGAAAALRTWIFDLPDAHAGDCSSDAVPRFAAEAVVSPHPAEAEFADLAIHQFGGPCDDLDAAQFATFVRLWNASGGRLAVPAPSG